MKAEGIIAKPAPSRPVYDARTFYLEDLARTLFPLTTNKVLVEDGANELLAYAEAMIAGAGSFLTQRQVHANKDALHLRRTVKLDAVAEFFLYHLILKNRTRFRKAHRTTHEHFGYRFVDGRPVAPSQSYGEFKQVIQRAKFLHEEFISFDVANYFNGIYHHDLHAWFAAIEPNDPADIVAFGKFLREINGGRSLDCLPQGLYPTKMIGNDFMRFVEESALLHATQVARFMDDVYLFGNDLDQLKADFAETQRVLGLKGLSVNASKTRHFGSLEPDEPEEQISDLKKRLLRRRRRLIISHYGDDYDGAERESAAIPPLDEDEIEFVLSLLSTENLSEDDAELILVVMRDHVDRIQAHLGRFARGFPHLAKNFYNLCGAASDKEAVARIVLNVASAGDHVGEYQLFWLGMMLELYLMDTALAPDIIRSLYRHSSATDISRAKILEIADLRYGLPEMREAYLRDGRSDWLSWSSAVGSRSMDKQARNYLLDYFKNGSAMNELIAGILQKA